MKNLINTIRNIFKIEDLRYRILATLGFLVIYRLGSHIVLPGVDPQQLGQLHRQTSEGILGLLDMFAGGAFSNASIFALGIMPYISASIVVQLLGIAIPYFQKLQKEGRKRQKKNQPDYPLSYCANLRRTGSGLHCKFTLAGSQRHYIGHQS
jgi:preprotein translocase subunit SecY